ncbi:uncharacterized protein LOC117227189 [Megalopta genalis]|uniref:uncharacterized protein LOC117227189 n=1 Tax=Megalopta genalis TaxID=115081 RepID=UPI003FD17DB1
MNEEAETGTWNLDASGSTDERRKPSHVRRLNFGQSILTLHVVKQFQGQRDGALTIDRNVAMIPCTSRGEFVRKWIETHRGTVTDTDEPAISSPVLGLPAAKRGIVRSPILLSQRKRARRKDSSVKKDRANRSSFSENERKENVRRNLFRTESTEREHGHVAVSPVLVKSMCKTEKKQVNGERKVLHRIENKRPETTGDFCNNRVTASPISYISSLKQRRPTGLWNTFVSSEEDTGNAILINTQKRRALAKKMEENFKQLDDADCVESDHSGDSRISKGSKISGDSRNLQAPVIARTLEDSKILDQSLGPILEHSKILDHSLGPISEHSKILEDSTGSDARDSARMEIESVPDDLEDSRDLTKSDTDGDANEHSVRIEDADTQDTDLSVPILPRVYVNNALRSIASTSISSKTQDSDQTYFSNAAQLGYPVAYQSQKISEISSLTTGWRGGKSAESGVIVNAESPLRMRAEPFMHFSLLDSTKKKKRKPKKGSLTEKLQAAINRQVSFLRIWRHQMKQAVKNNVSLPCVTVHTLECVISFNRQFLEGVAIEDPFNLLPTMEGSRFPRRIRIMTVPEIVGKIESRTASLVQIFPPWEMLDDKKLTLNVTYINVISDDPGVVRENTNDEPARLSVVQEFDCPCIRTGKMNMYCSERCNKPDVIEGLFDVEQ